MSSDLDPIWEKQPAARSNKPQAASPEQSEIDHVPPLPVLGMVLGTFGNEASPENAAIVANRLSDVLKTWKGGKQLEFAVDSVPGKALF